MSMLGDKRRFSYREHADDVVNAASGNTRSASPSALLRFQASPSATTSGNLGSGILVHLQCFSHGGFFNEFVRPMEQFRVGQ
jgi:hypothetical protein